MNTRDPWSEQLFARWLHERVHKYQPLTFQEYKKTVSDTVSTGATPEKQEEDSGSSVTEEVNPCNPAEEHGPWDGAYFDEAGVRPSPDEALGQTREPRE